MAGLRTCAYFRVGYGHYLGRFPFQLEGSMTSTIDAKIEKIRASIKKLREYDDVDDYIEGASYIIKETLKLCRAAEEMEKELTERARFDTEPKYLCNGHNEVAQTARDALARAAEVLEGK